MGLSGPAVGGGATLRSTLTYTPLTLFEGLAAREERYTSRGRDALQIITTLRAVTSLQSEGARRSVRRGR